VDGSRGAATGESCEPDRAFGIGHVRADNNAAKTDAQSVRTRFRALALNSKSGLKPGFRSRNA